MKIADRAEGIADRASLLKVTDRVACEIANRAEGIADRASLLNVADRAEGTADQT
jgi:hypothetical protein